MAWNCQNWHHIKGDLFTSYTENLQLAPKMHSALLTCIVVNICQHPRWQPCYHSQDERNVNVIS